MKIVLFALLCCVTLWFVAAWCWAARRSGVVEAPGDPPRRSYHAIVSLVTCFFDTLGIGNFAPTTSLFKLRSSVRDERIPGTLNVGYTIPTVLQAYIYITIIEVDPLTLASLIAASVVGAWLGAGVVARWPRRKIQFGMGFALLAAAALMTLSQFRFVPGGGEGLALRGLGLAAGVVGNLFLGALMTLGIGLYAPCLIMVSLLGMSPRAAFPIMMGSCAFLMPVAGLRFIRQGRYDRSASLILSIAGLPAVLIAAYLVKEMPLAYVRWLVVAVVLYAASIMLTSALFSRKVRTSCTPKSMLDPSVSTDNPTSKT